MDIFDFSKFPTLTTNRLILREILLEDAPDVFIIRGDYQVTRYNTGPAYSSVDQARRLIQSIRDGYVTRDELRWGITLKGGDNRVIGMVGFNYWNRTDRRASIGYDLARAYWRQGIMSEALRPVLRFGFTDLNLHRIEANVTEGNTASARTLLKMGFQQEGVWRERIYLRGRFHDMLQFGLLRREFEG